VQITARVGLAVHGAHLPQDVTLHYGHPPTRHTACALHRAEQREMNATNGEVVMRVQDVMTRDPECVTPSATIREAAQIMQRENVGIIPVVEEKGTKRLLGVVTDRDIAIRVVAQGRDGGTRVSEVMSTSKLATCAPDDDVNDAMEAMASEQLRRIPIVDERGSLIGIVAQADIVRKAKDSGRAERTVQQISEPTGKHAQ
jgi:CBS domain-containing protein